MTSPNPRRLLAVLIANGLLRVAASGGGALVGFYLAALALRGQPVGSQLVGALGAVVSIAEVAAALPIGVLTDRWSPRALLVLGSLLGALATQLFGVSGAVAAFYIARALQGVATAASGPALLAYLADVTRGGSAGRGRVMSLYELSLLVGLALGGLVGGALWDGFGQLAFSLLALVYLVAAGLFFWGVAPATSGAASQHPLAGLRRAWADPLLRRLAPAWLAMNAIIGMWLTHIGFQLSGPPAAGQFLVGRFTASQVGYILLGYALVFAAGVTAWGYLLARVTRIRALRITIAGMLLACVWLYMLNASDAWPAWARWAVVALLIASVLVESGFTPAGLTYLADLAGQSDGRGAAMGIYTLLLGLGSAFGAGLGGWLAQSLALNGILLGTVGLALLAMAGLALLPDRVDTRSPNRDRL